VKSWFQKPGFKVCLRAQLVYRYTEAEKKKAKAINAQHATAAAADAAAGGEQVDEAEAEMMRMMGFGGFNSTTNKYVVGRAYKLTAVDP
jgi:hypothetical protein